MATDLVAYPANNSLFSDLNSLFRKKNFPAPSSRELAEYL